MFKRLTCLGLVAIMSVTTLTGCGVPDATEVKIGYESIDGQVKVIETATQGIENGDVLIPNDTERTPQITPSPADAMRDTLCYDNPMSVPKNSVVQLYAVTEPAEATDNVTWKSDNEELATVDANGLLTLYNAEGAATIVVTTENDLQAILTVNITKTEEELANEELAKAMAELAKETTTPEQAQAKLDELQSKYGNLSDNQKQQLQPAINNLKGAVQDKKTAKANSSAKGNGGSSKPSGGSSKPSGGGSTGGGNTGGGNTGGGTPQPAEKYYPTMTPAEMEAYARQVAASLDLQYVNDATPKNACWNTPSTTFPGCTKDNIKSNISSGISSLKGSWHKPPVQGCRLYAEPTGATDSAGNKQYTIYILYG